MTKLTRAAAYYRMSDPRQDASIERQEQAVRAYAEAHGYAIVHTFKDEGLPGGAAEVERRAGFKALLAAATTGAFDCILVYELGRFGRFGPIDFGYFTKPLRDRGVYIVTTDKGPLRWDTLPEQVMSGFETGAKEAYVKDMSRAISDAAAKRAGAGQWLHRVPYAYRIDYKRDPRTGQLTVPDRLTPGDPDKVKAVRWMFKTYNSGSSLTSIRDELNRRGVLPPSGKGFWNTQTIRHLLANPVYVGDVVDNRGTTAKYHPVVGGRATPRTTPAPLTGGKNGHKPCVKRERHHEREWITAKDAHPALVSRELFEAVQKRLAARTWQAKERDASGKRKRKPLAEVRTTPHQGGGPFILTGLLKCCNCGERMVGRQRTNADGSVSVFYECGGYHRNGKAKCLYRVVPQTPIVQFAVRKLVEQFGDKAKLAAVERKVEALLRGLYEADPVAVDALRAELARLDAKVARAAENALLAPPDHMEEFSAALRRLKAERGEMAERLARAEQAPKARADLSRRVDLFMDQLILIRSIMNRTRGKKPDPAHLRNLLASLVDRIELDFADVKANGRVSSRFKGGCLHPKVDGLGAASILPEVFAFPALTSPGPRGTHLEGLENQIWPTKSRRPSAAPDGSSGVGVARPGTWARNRSQRGTFRGTAVNPLISAAWGIVQK
jgi:DNA invertase Pin-like site-specific DNA recombinase